jgi:hypothetical protein
VILLVGAFDAFDENTAKQAGAVANITKPFEPQSLIDLVSSLMPAAGGADDEDDDPGASSPPEKILPLDMPASADLLGLEDLFPAESPDARAAAGAVSEEAIERIADRVIQKLTTQVIESIAWDVVPDITEKILREELKKK